MNNIRRPSEFFYSFKGAFAKENSTKIIVLIPFFMLIIEHELSFEQIFIIQEINLQPCIWKRCHFNLKRKIIIINRYINAREPDYLVKPVTAFVNHAKTGHNTSY